ncbi:hypothetical protein [Roseospira navarrensis]|uniref:Uncharacterized protein n=1 Tax=Roseospira navarrensis TaxID=140058 RepID=A0A7X1ZFP0_9PROT|nr:hypothetical protein [Roseospira navarrensis]MQX36721.1 hypothetical protein [Roseospira navarrensis]
MLTPSRLPHRSDGPELGRRPLLRGLAALAAAVPLAGLTRPAGAHIGALSGAQDETALVVVDGPHGPGPGAPVAGDPATEALRPRLAALMDRVGTVVLVETGTPGAGVQIIRLRPGRDGRSRAVASRLVAPEAGPGLARVLRDMGVRDVILAGRVAGVRDAWTSRDPDAAALRVTVAPDACGPATDVNGHRQMPLV